MRLGLVLTVVLAVSIASATAQAQSTSSGVFTSVDAVLAPLMRPGREVDATKFTHRRQVRLYPSTAGVSRYQLTPSDLALARADLGDLRVVDAAGRQAAFIVDRSRRERVHVTVSSEGRRGAESRHRIDLPQSPLTVVAVELDVDAAFVHRSYRLVAELEGDDSTVASGVLRQSRAHHAAISLPLREDTRADRLVLYVDDGDDAPLRVAGASVTLAGADLLVLAPSGAYRLLLGNEDVHAPRYELARARSSVMAAAAGEAHAGPLEPNPSHAPRFEPAPAPKRDQAPLLWGAIGLSVIILGGLTLHVARTP